MVLERARQVEEGDARAQREREPVGEVEVAPERRAAGELDEPLRNGRHAGEAQVRRAAAPRHVQPPDELVAEVVAHGSLDTGQGRRRKEAIARRRVEEELAAAGAEKAPARTLRPLLRI